MAFQRKHLAMLVAIAEGGSMHKAALRLGMTQPAVSRMVAEVERTVGARLFERGASGSLLTAKGDALVAHARFLLRGMERMDEVAHAQAVAIRFGCIPRAMHTLMPFIVNLMSPPTLQRLQVQEDGSHALFDAVRRGALDFAVLRHVGGAAGVNEALQAQPLYDETPLVIAGPKHPLARRRALTLGALIDHRWVLPSAETTTRAVLDRYFQIQGLAPIRPVIETRSFESSAALVAGTDLLSIIPEAIARVYERVGLVRVLKVAPPLPGTAVLLVHQSQVLADPVLQRFRDLVVSAADQARRANALRA